MKRLHKHITSSLTLAIRKNKFKARFLKKVFARLHMSLIMICTVLSGLILSKIMLIMSLDTMLIRYPIALVGAYLSFFIFMKLWLLYLTSPYRKKQADTLDALEFVAPDIGRSADYSTKVKVGGGQFGGAGAGGAFEYDEGVTEISESIGSTSIVAEADTDGVAEVVGEAAEIAEEGGLFLISLALILIFFLGGGAFLIYKAPLILSEAAFEVVLASSLIKSSRKMDSPDWIGSVFRTTWKPFLFTLLVSVVGALLLNTLCPQAIKLTDVLKECI